VRAAGMGGCMQWFSAWAWASGICFEGMEKDSVQAMLLEFGDAVLGCAGRSGASGRQIVLGSITFE
jgi:hypothetical protein